MPQLTSLVKQCLHNSAKHRPPVMLVVGRLALAISKEKDSGDNILAVSYFNKELDQTNYNLKITLAKGTSRVNKLCAIVRSPVTFGFTGTFKGIIPSSQIKLSCPMDVVISKEGCAYICDYNGKTGVLAYNIKSGATKKIIKSASSLSSRRSSRNKCWYPRGVAVQDDINVIYLSDTHNHRVLKCSTSVLLNVAGKMLEPGSGANRFNHPSGIAINGRQVYVCDTENHRIVMLNSHNLGVEGEFCHDDMRPIDIAIDKGGRFVYILDCTNSNIRIFREGDHELLHTINLKEPQYLELSNPEGICVDTNNFIYVTDKYKHCVLVLDAAGKFKMLFGTQGSREGEFNAPSGIDVDSQGNVYVCDSGNRRIQVFS